MAALSIAALVPALDSLVTFARHRRLDVLGIFILVSLLLGIAVVFIGGSPKLILIRESFLTAAFGLGLLVSLLFPRPILFYFASHFATGNDPIKKAEFNSWWSYPYFRFVMNLMTIVWGASLLLEAVVRTLLVFALTTGEFLFISPIIQYGFFGAVMIWTLWYAKRSKERGEELQRQWKAAELGNEAQLTH